ncbi:efflux transporter, outer membrane factor lipoprotein, NodT family [Burkholderiales bacterium JOSHI_001]|nr:efflux transporter, outer membrane factor lipoprotein, NodT family [Burkholderiales bacterium JOSHI_001]
MKRLHTRALALAVAAALAACAQPQPPKTPANTLPARFAASDASASAVLSTRWWTLYDEPALDALVQQALDSNLDLRAAAARVDETAVAVGLARAAQWPTLDASAAFTRSRSSALNGTPSLPGGPESSTHRVGLSTSFEIDLWGRLRNATQAAQEQLLAAEYARDAVRLATVGALVQAWWSVRALDAQQALLAQQRQMRQDSLDLVAKRVRGGVASGLDAAQAESAVATLDVQQAELQRQRALLVNGIGLLAGQPDLSVPVDRRVLPVPVTVPAGLPSELLTRRPDVQQAEAAMRASFAQFDVVKKSAWPTLSLTGSLGLQSQDLTDLLKSGARTWSLGPSLLVSLFDAGRNAARADEARARAEQAAIAWQRASQVAFREVADALANAQGLNTQEQHLLRQQRAAQEALRIANRRYENGYSGFLDVLESQRSALDADLGLLRLRQQRMDASVALVKALGGGWEAPAR